MSEYSASQAAEKIGTDPKTLRRFLRENASYRNVGSGGRYVFTDTDVPPLEKSFKAWVGTRRSKSTSTSKEVVTTPAIKSKDAKARADKRVDALESSLKTRGVHISQHAEPTPGWDTGGLEETCDICQEPMRDGEEVGEFVPDIAPEGQRPVIAHAQCGLDMGLELA